MCFLNVLTVLEEIQFSGRAFQLFTTLLLNTCFLISSLNLLLNNFFLCPLCYVRWAYKISLSVTGVLRPLVHVCGTRCQLIYGSVIVSGSLNGCSILICLILETAALCDIFVRSTCINPLTYLLTYLQWLLLSRCRCTQGSVPVIFTRRIVMSMSLCLSVRSHNSKTTRPIFTSSLRMMPMAFARASTVTLRQETFLWLTAVHHVIYLLC